MDGIAFDINVSWERFVIKLYNLIKKSVRYYLKENQRTLIYLCTKKIDS